MFKRVKDRRFTDEIRNLDLEKVLVVPIDSGKNSHKALVANYFGDILRDPFEFTNSASGVKMFHTILKRISSSNCGSEGNNRSRFYWPLL